MSVEFSGLFSKYFKPFLEIVIPRFNFTLVSWTDETDYGCNIAVFQNDDMRLRLMREEGAYLVDLGAVHSDEWMSLRSVLEAAGVPPERLREDLGSRADEFSKSYGTIAAELRIDRYPEFHKRYKAAYKAAVGYADPWA